MKCVKGYIISSFSNRIFLKRHAIINKVLNIWNGTYNTLENLIGNERWKGEGKKNLIISSPFKSKSNA